MLVNFNFTHTTNKHPRLDFEVEFSGVAAINLEGAQQEITIMEVSYIDPISGKISRLPITELLSQHLETGPMGEFLKSCRVAVELTMKRRFTMPLIESLAPNEVFVFGSNLAGAHGGGAASYAAKLFGAQSGIGEGPTGQCYAIPTCDKNIQKLKITQIALWVDCFIDFAKENHEKTFLVTPIACGIAGYSHSEIAPLFKGAIDIKNIHLPESFWKLII